MDRGLVAFYESAVRYDDMSQLVAHIESFVRHYFNCQTMECRLAYAQSGQAVENCADFANSPEWVPLHSFDGTLVAHIKCEKPIPLTFCKMAAWSIRRQQILQLEREQASLIQSLELAKTLVEEGLPTRPIRHSGWEIFGQLHSAAHIGGDLFSIMPVGELTHFLLLDAVGHGVHSALLAAQCKALWRGVIRGRNLSDSVHLLNRLIFEDSGSERFVAATLGLCFPDGQLQYVSCGQSPVFLGRSEGLAILEACDPPLGLFADTEFEVQYLELSPGEGLICVTDGILESGTADSGMFSEEGVERSLKDGFPARGCEELVDKLVTDVSSFEADAVQRDDICCIALVRLPP
jgi:serine phosphatase RsbU (regulator of sigma subunit)